MFKKKLTLPFSITSMAIYHPFLSTASMSPRIAPRLHRNIITLYTYNCDPRCHTAAVLVRNSIITHHYAIA
jgi:hypothetical protein